MRNRSLTFFGWGIFLFSLYWAGVRAETDTNAKHFIDPTFTPVLKRASTYTVAVLPMESIVVHDPVVSGILRDRVMERLRAKGYITVNTDLLDGALQRLGVLHAGQLNRLTLEQLSAITSADAFMSGAVEEAGPEHRIVSNSYVYTSSLKLQDRSGKVLWYALQERVAKLRIALDPFNAVLDAILIDQGGNEHEAVKAVADRMLSSFPSGPVRVRLKDPLLERAQPIRATTRE